MKTAATEPDHKFWRMLKDSSMHQAEWRKDCELNLKYYDGDQWTSSEKQILEDRGQQATVINICRPTIDSLHAIYQQRKTDLQVVGREIDDDEAGGLFTHLLKQSFDENNFSYLESQWFRSGGMTGIGWMQVRVNNKLMINGERDREIDLVQVPFEELYFDPYFRKMDGSDMRYVIRRVWMDADQLKAKFPSKADQINDFARTFWEEGEDFQEHYAQENAGGSSNGQLDSYDRRTSRIAVQECWYFDHQRKLRYCVFVHGIFLVGGEDDSQNEDPHGLNIIPFIPYIANRDRRGLPKGLLSFIRGIQDSINKMYSKYQWNMSSRQLLYEESALDDMEEARSEIAKPDGVIRVNDGALQSNRVQIPKNIEESAHLSNMIQMQLQMAQRVTGINDALMGIGGVNARSAMQESSRQIQGAQMQTAAIENMFAAKRRLAWVMLMFMGKYVDKQKVVRVVGLNGNVDKYTINEPYVDEEGNERIYRMEDALRYDVVLKLVPAFDTVRQNTLQIISEMAKGGVIPPVVASQIALELSEVPNKQELMRKTEEWYAQQQQLASLQAQGGGA